MTLNPISKTQKIRFKSKNKNKDKIIFEFDSI